MQPQVTETKKATFQTLPCECCNSEKLALVCHRDDSTRIMRCRECSLESVNPLPDKNQIDLLYNRQMKGDAFGLSADNPYFRGYIAQHIEREQSFKKIYKKWLDLIERFHHGRGDLLDIGCGAGFFLHYAKTRGWNVHGIDLLSDYIRFAKEELKLDNTQDLSLEEANFEPHSFDVITLWDFIEHLQHPLAKLQKINRLLKPGGIVAIWTPNVKNAVFMKERWIGYAVQQHLYFFSLRTLSEILQRTGFRIAFSRTNKTKKGLLISKESLTFQAGSLNKKELEKPQHLPGRLWFSVKRDIKNTLNPMTYLDPLLSLVGFGFNLLVIAVKEPDKDT